MPWCNVFPFHISWVEAIAWTEEKKNQTKEPNKATSFQHHHGNVHLKMQIRWIDQIQSPISLVASLDTVPVICWNSTSFTSIGKVHAHTHTQTNEHRVSFLQCSPEKRPFSSSTFGCKDFKCGEWGAFVELLLCLVYRRKKNLKRDRGRDCNPLPCRNASESKLIRKRNALKRILRMPHVHRGSSQMDL